MIEKDTVLVWKRPKLSWNSFNPEAASLDNLLKPILVRWMSRDELEEMYPPEKGSTDC